jgi:GAF domain
LKDLVAYLGGNQGAVYIIENEQDKDSYISCVAAFAYNRQKFLNKTFQMGEGLVGRCILENDMIYMDDIPQNYINITSGLGSASPRSVLLSPVTFNEITYGVLEIASFYALKPYQIEFVKNLSQIFGSTVANAKINANTQKLLDNSRLIANVLEEKEKLLQENTLQLSTIEQQLALKEKELESLKILLSSNTNGE